MKGLLSWLAVLVGAGLIFVAASIFQPNTLVLGRWDAGVSSDLETITYHCEGKVDQARAARGIGREAQLDMGGVFTCLEPNGWIYIQATKVETGYHHPAGAPPGVYWYCEYQGKRVMEYYCCPNYEKALEPMLSCDGNCKCKLVDIPKYYGPSNWYGTVDSLDYSASDIILRPPAQWQLKSKPYNYWKNDASFVTIYKKGYSNPNCDWLTHTCNVPETITPTTVVEVTTTVTPGPSPTVTIGPIKIPEPRSTLEDIVFKIEQGWEYLKELLFGWLSA